MYKCETGVEDSPSRVGNFLISYANEVDLVSDLGLNDLKHLLNVDLDKDLQILSNTDSSFIPRAFTDADLLDGLIPRQDNSKELVDQKDKPETVKSESSHLNGKVVFTDMAKRPDENMDNFKPDVVLSNSHHRSGPDGSPALAPPATRGFMNANISETSELFAPVRTLTFSDIDQSSHIEDSYVNTSRLVSTPNKDERRPAANQYDYSSMQGALYQTGDVNNLQGNGRPYVDDSNSSDSDNVVNVGRDRSPEFRQLEGEAESDFQSTGPFHPSAQGLSKEFMDQFVGKTSNPGFDNDMDSIFSPLGSNGLKVSERRMESRTPPLHSPAPNSPLAKYAKGSPRSPYTRGPQQPQHDPDEIQFEMSPTRSTKRATQPFQREVIGNGANVEDSRAINYEMYHQDLREYSFKPVDNPIQMMNQGPRNVPKNLNEYFNQSDHEHLAALTAGGISKQSEFNAQHMHAEPEGQDNDLDLDSRQGDGSDSDGDEGPHRLPQMIQPGQPRAQYQMRQSEPVSIQRMQVSVKLPQATYDTLSADTSRDDKFNSETAALKNASGDCPPDIALSGAAGSSATREIRTSPEKVMDLLQNQSESWSADGTGVSQKQNNQSSFGNIGYSANKPDIDISSLQPLNHFNMQSEEKMRYQANDPVTEQSVTADKNNSVQETAVNKAHTQNTLTSQANSKLISGQTTAASQGNNQSQNPVSSSSRLRQATVSQRNKTSQKYVSNVPGGKAGSTNQNKDFKKPYDVPQRNTNTAPGSQGARKPIMNDPNQKFKVSDKVKPKTNSTENLAQRQRGSNGAQSRNGNQPQGQINQQRGQNQRGQHDTSECQRFQGHGEGQGHDGSLHSIEDGGESNKIVTQVQTTSPVPIEVPEQTVDRVQVGVSTASSVLSLLTPI